MCLVNQRLYLNNISALDGEEGEKVCVWVGGLVQGEQPSWANSSLYFTSSWWHPPTTSYTADLLHHFESTPSKGQKRGETYMDYGISATPVHAVITVQGCHNSQRARDLFLKKAVSLMTHWTVTWDKLLHVEVLRDCQPLRKVKITAWDQHNPLKRPKYMYKLQKKCGACVTGAWAPSDVRLKHTYKHIHTPIFAYCC